MAEHHELLDVGHLLKHDRDDSSSTQALHPISSGVGKPQKRTAINLVDCFAITAVIVCAAVAILVISPSIPIAASLGFKNQIIIIGLLLSLMQICQQRIAQRLLLILEAQSKRSTIHNFDGLLRWSFLTPHFAWVWRIVIVTLMTVPLVLGVLYKQFIGGTATTSYTASLGVFHPAALAGSPDAGTLTAFMNKTNALFIASSNDALVPTTSQFPKAYGPALLLISDGIAASLDEPENIVEIQNSLPADSALYFSADVRGTVSRYNDSVESHRSDGNFWNSFGGSWVGWPINGDPGCQFGFQIQDGSTVDVDRDSTHETDLSYAFLGGYAGSINGVVPASRDAFHNTSILFNTLRYDCHAKWRLTPSSFDLVTGSCSPQPLPLAFQYTKNTILEMAQAYTPALGEILGPFSICEARYGSPWYKSTAAGMLAAAYSVRMATMNIRPVFNGSFYTPPITYNLTTEQRVYGDLPRQNQTFIVFDQNYQPSNVDMYLEVPTLRANWGLYVVLLVQPVITALAFALLILLYNSPIGAGFGLVSILAGVDTRSVDVLKGASFSGELSREVGMAISVLEYSDEEGKNLNTIQYTVGETRSRGKVKTGVLYS